MACRRCSRDRHALPGRSRLRWIRHNHHRGCRHTVPRVRRGRCPRPTRRSRRAAVCPHGDRRGPLRPADGDPRPQIHRSCPCHPRRRDDGGAHSRHRRPWRRTRRLDSRRTCSRLRDNRRRLANPAAPRLTITRNNDGSVRPPAGRFPRCAALPANRARVTTIHIGRSTNVPEPVDQSAENRAPLVVRILGRSVPPLPGPARWRSKARRRAIRGPHGRSN